MRLCTTFAIGMTITIFWKLFYYKVKRDHYEKLTSIREFSEQLAQDCFNNNFSPETGTPEKNIPPLDEVDDGDIVSNCRVINFPVVFIPPQRPSLFPT